MLDLHTHTQASDGELTAKDLWTRYSEKNMGLGISDHLFRDGLSTEHGICAYLSQENNTIVLIFKFYCLVGQFDSRFLPEKAS